MNTIYINVINGYQLNLNSKAIFHKVERLAHDYLNNNPDVIYSISSHIYTNKELISEFESFGTIINSVEAHVKGIELQPDRTIKDPAGSHEYSFNNVIPMDLTKAKAFKDAEINSNTRELINCACDKDLSGTYSDEVDGIVAAGKVLRDSVIACTDYQSIINIVDER